jgi:signal peptidase II
MKSTLSIKMTLFIIGFMVVLDQVSKYIIKNNLDLYKPKQIFGSFFRLTYIENEGAAFGVQLGSPKLFLVLSIIAAILVFYYLIRMRDKNWLLQLAMSFIAAGAIGNLSDRILHGKVVDFFDIEFFDISIPSFNLFGWTLSGYSMTRWPIFNVADIAITCGMIIILSYLIFIGDPLISFQKQTASLSNESNGNI